MRKSHNHLHVQPLLLPLLISLNPFLKSPGPWLCPIIKRDLEAVDQKEAIRNVELASVVTTTPEVDLQFTTNSVLLDDRYGRKSLQLAARRG